MRVQASLRRTEVPLPPAVQHAKKRDFYCAEHLRKGETRGGKDLKQAKLAQWVRENNLTYLVLQSWGNAHLRSVKPDPTWKSCRNLNKFKAEKVDRQE